MRILPIPIRSDNYMYLVVEQQRSSESTTTTSEAKLKALLVDPADPKALEKAHAEAGQANIDVDIVGVLTTHHHGDHAGGNDIIAKALPSIPIYGGSTRVQGANNIVKDEEEITLGNSIKIKCLATPCHTQDSVCYYATYEDQKAVFTGDTLFQGGCGRFFEGTPEEMHKALSYLGTLPNDTIVYNGHEYTADNLRFAKTVDPANSALSRLQSLVDSNKITTGKSTIGDEKEWNVFMRLNSEAIMTGTGKSNPAEVMEKLREMKNAM